ncbi:hypothetical protein A9Q99_10255 [Gammaproteobacteria bacterium 45_16_T64]|nr:hypothetical protein A9Q99_10255 [Gammaproteobacteria bacterium 45_16_T64]
MNTAELMNILKAGNDREISDVSYSLLNLSDTHALKKLAADIEQITPLSSPSYWMSNENKNVSVWQTASN